MTTIVSVVGDLHVNATTALCPPVFTLDDGGTYRASGPQRWIWRQWLAYWNEVAERREGKRLVIVLNGELADDNKHATTQLVTRNPADQLRLAVDALKPATDLLREGDHLFVLRGTEAHSGIASHLDELIARDLGATGAGNGDDGPVSWSQLRAEFGGVRFDIAHHPPGGGGRVPWTRANFAARLAAAAFYEAAERGVKPPHLLIRGHVHRPGDSYDAAPVRAMILPSWKLADAYSYRIGGGFLPVGGCFFECDGKGGYTVNRRYHDWPTPGVDVRL